VSTANRRRDLERWLAYVRRTEAKLVSVHTRLVEHHLERMHALDITGMVTMAEAAVEALNEALEARVAEFHGHQTAERVGPRWETVRNSYIGACVRMQRVCTTLCTAVGVLLTDDAGLVSTSVYRIVHMEHEILDIVPTLLVEKTQRCLAQAQAIFIGSFGVTRSVIPTSNLLGAD